MPTAFIVFWTLTFTPNFQGSQTMLLHQSFETEDKMLVFVHRVPRDVFECTNYDLNGKCVITDIFVQKYDGKNWGTNKCQMNR